ncbi:MAG: S-layer homology domain-containing protein, partial [Oscillospiraceae bacterium]
EDDNKNVTITFVPEDGFVFDAAYVGNEPVDLKDNSYTFGEVTADVTIKVLFKQDSVPITPVTPMPAPGEISDLIKDSITVDCVNGEVAHADKVYGLLDGSLVNVEKTDDTSIKVTLDATVYQARYNTDTETKHSLADGQSATVTITLKYVDDGWTLPADAGELPATIKVVCATPAAPKAPTEDELKALFDGKVFVDCVEKSWHPTYAYGLLADGYTVAGPVKGADGEYTCTVTLLASAYLAEYNDDVTDKHTLASYQGNETVALKWTGSAWTVINGELPVTFDVVCDTWYPPYIPPVAPSEPVYRPNWLNTTDHFGYIIGYEDGTIKPNASITRAEVATIFFRLLTDEARDKFWTETNSYSDVAPTAWYNNAVSTLSRMGILGGYEDGSFRPNDSITRAEFAKIAVSFFEYEDISAENIFTDVAAGSWYESFVAVAAKLGLIEGYAGNVYRPNESITRAEACTIINRTLGRAPDADHLLPESQMNTWPDNRPGVWYYAQLQEATNSHEYKWSGDIEHWTAKLPERDWDALQR